MWQGFPLILHRFNTVLEVLSSRTGQLKENNGKQIVKEVKKLLFAGDTTVYIFYTKNSTKEIDNW